MGELNCKLCDCRDQKNELEARTTLQLPDLSDNSFLTENTQDITHSPVMLTLGHREIQQVTQIQATWKSYRVRKLMLHVRKSRQANFSYFGEEERRETLSEAPLETIRESKTFLYRSGGSYNGEWLGGFRDGYGRMKWPDGTSYEGHWSYGIAFGEGMFRHVDGEEFEGMWSRFPISYREVFMSEGDLKTMVSWPFKNGYGKP